MDIYIYIYIFQRGSECAYGNRALKTVLYYPPRYIYWYIYWYYHWLYPHSQSGRKYPYIDIYTSPIPPLSIYIVCMLCYALMYISWGEWCVYKPKQLFCLYIYMNCLVYLGPMQVIRIEFMVDCLTPPPTLFRDENNNVDITYLIFVYFQISWWNSARCRWLCLVWSSEREIDITMHAPPPMQVRTIFL